MSKSISLVSSKNILPKTRALSSHLAPEAWIVRTETLFQQFGFSTASLFVNVLHSLPPWKKVMLNKTLKKSEERKEASPALRPESALPLHLLPSPCSPTTNHQRLFAALSDPISRTCWIKHSFRNSLSPVQHPSRLWGSWALQAFWGREESSFLSHRGRRRGWRTWTRPPARTGSCKRTEDLNFLSWFHTGPEINICNRFGEICYFCS